MTFCNEGKKRAPQNEIDSALFLTVPLFMGKV